MMTSRSAVLAAFADLLGSTPAGAAVYVERSKPLAEDTRNAVLIDPVEESSLDDDESFDGQVMDLTVRVSCVARTPADRDALADSVRSALEQGLPSGVHRGLTGTTFTKEAELESPVFAAHMTYRAVYTT